MMGGSPNQMQSQFTSGLFPQGGHAPTSADIQPAPSAPAATPAPAPAQTTQSLIQNLWAMHRPFETPSAQDIQDMRSTIEQIFANRRNGNSAPAYAPATTPPAMDPRLATGGQRPLDIMTGQPASWMTPSTPAVTPAAQQQVANPFQTLTAPSNPLQSFQPQTGLSSAANPAFTPEAMAIMRMLRGGF